MDDYQTRAIKNLRQRHTDKIRQHAEHIQEYASYLLQRLDGPGSPSYYARDIASDAQELVTRFAALEAITDAVGILETSDEPAKETGQ